jgi:hypothetical protein
LRFSLPVEKKEYFIKDDGAEDKRVESIPYITPVPLEESKVLWIGEMVEEVNRYNPTGESLSSGTILALPIADLESSTKQSSVEFLKETMKTTA